MLLDARPTGGGEDDDGDAAGREILLVFQILIGGDQNFEPGLSACSSSSPFMSASRLSSNAVLTWAVKCLLRGAVCLDRNTRTHVASRERVACSRTRRACSRVTPGNHARNSESCAPSSRFWKSAATGTRVPRNTQAPLTRWGSLSTAGHEDQSIIRSTSRPPCPLNGIRTLHSPEAPAAGGRHLVRAAGSLPVSVLGVHRSSGRASRGNRPDRGSTEHPSKPRH